MTPAVMVGPILLLTGFAFLAMTWLCPHRTFWRRWWSSLTARVLSNEAIRIRYRIELPSQREFLWNCYIEPSKVPLVVNELNELRLVARPSLGPRSSAHVEVPISSTSELARIDVRATSSTLEVRDMGKLALQLSGPSEARCSVIPRVPGDASFRVEFWQGDVLRGCAIESLQIRVRQYGVVLPVSVTATLMIVGLLLGTVGSIVSIVTVIGRFD